MITITIKTENIEETAAILRVVKELNLPMQCKEIPAIRNSPSQEYGTPKPLIAGRRFRMNKQQIKKMRKIKSVKGRTTFRQACYNSFLAMIKAAE